MRVKQYIKNLLIFAPLFFAQQLFSKSTFLNLTVVFIGFSLITSFIYILNDIKDVELDRNHPHKSKRPLACGKLSIRTAYILAILSLLCGISLISSDVILICAVYIVLNLLYVYKLKNIALLDIILIASGYLIRLFIGGIVAGVELSQWIIIMIFLLSLFLAISKRYDDLQYVNRESIRDNINGYNSVFIENTMSFLAAIIVVSYILYTISPAIISQYHCDYLYTTALFVLVGILRYLQIVFVYKKSDSPTNIIYSDVFLKLTILCWIVSYVWIIYV